MDYAANEAPIWLEINGRRRVCWTCTPERIEELVVGRLLSDAYISATVELERFERIDEPDGCVGIRVHVPEENVARVAQERRHEREHGCGLLRYVSCTPELLRRERTAVTPGPEVLRAAFRTLFTATDAAYPDGGMHAALLWTEAGLQQPVFDVARHNTIDRALGRALRDRIPLSSAGMLLSARVSGAIAAKAARAGVGFLASRSIATSLAIRIAEAGRLPVVVRAGARAERSDP